MVHGVANDVCQRLRKSIQNSFIEIGILTCNFKRDILSAVLGDIANYTREAAEELFHGNHANFEYGFVKLIKNARLKCQCVRHFRAERIAGMVLVKFRESAMEHGLADNELANEVHDGINTRCIHAKNA